MKNVHFSPVVSQLRYPRASNYSNAGTESVSTSSTAAAEAPYSLSTSFNDNPEQGGGDPSGAIKKVMVQQVDTQKVQKIQVQVPPTPVPANYLEETGEGTLGGLFVNQLKILSARQEMAGAVNKNPAQFTINNYQNPGIFKEKRFSDELPPPPDDLEELISKAGPVTGQNWQLNRNGNMVGSLEEFLQVPDLDAAADKRQRVTSWPNQVKSDELEAKADNASGDKQKCSKSSGKNCKSGGGSKKKGSSKKFLQWISFGKLGSGVNSQGKNCNGSGGASAGASVGKSSKRSSCPPLGHPLLLNGGGGGVDSASSNFNVGLWSAGGGPKENGDLAVEQVKKKDEQVIKLTVVDNQDSPKTSKSNGKPPRPHHSKNCKGSSSLPPLHHPGSSISGDSDDEFSVNFERIIEAIFDSGTLEESQSPVLFAQGISHTSTKNRTSTKKMTSQQDQGQTQLTSLPDFHPNGCMYHPMDESLLENMEEKHLAPGGVAGDDLDNIPEVTSPVPAATAKKSATIPVTGKPPKPPSSFNLAAKHYGVRPSALSSSRGNHPHLPPKDYLSSKNSSNSSRQAMLELAHKLEAFREELHRSREHIASTHQTNLDSIHTRRNYIFGVGSDFDSELVNNGSNNNNRNMPLLLIPSNSGNSTGRTTPSELAAAAAATEAGTATGIDPAAQRPPNSGARSRPASASYLSRNTRNTSTATTTTPTAQELLQNVPPEYTLLQQQSSSSNFGGAGASSSAAPPKSKKKSEFSSSEHFGGFAGSTNISEQEWSSLVLRAKHNFTQRGKPTSTQQFWGGKEEQVECFGGGEGGGVGVGGTIHYGNTDRRDPSTAEAATDKSAKRGRRAATSNNRSNGHGVLETDLDSGVLTLSSGAPSGAQGGNGFTETGNGFHFAGVDWVDGQPLRSSSAQAYSSSSVKRNTDYFSYGAAEHARPVDGFNRGVRNATDYCRDYSEAPENNDFEATPRAQGHDASVVVNKKRPQYWSASLQNLNSAKFSAPKKGSEFSEKYYGSQEDFAGDIAPGGGEIMTTLKPEPNGGAKEDRSRSMEFLLDSEKNAHLRAPENTLQKTQQPHQAQAGLDSGTTTPTLPGTERRMSEHELRIQRSLQKLNVPDWYKNYAPSQPSSAAGTPSKTRGGDFGGSGTGLAGGWPGLSSSKTNSLTSLQSAGRYSGSKSGFGAYGSSGGGAGGSQRHYRGGSATAPGMGRSSRESLMSPSSTASASPSPNFERSSFTYGMPYALTRFAAARMSCGASPASLSPSPSPVGGIPLSSTSTPVSSGPSARYQGYQKQPYLGWRSQERLSSKSLYRSPAERLAADLIAQQKAKQSPLQTPQTPQPPSQVATPQSPQVQISGQITPQVQIVSPAQFQQHQQHAAATAPPPEIEVNRTSPTKSNVTSATASDLSLNNSEESNSHKLNRVRSSIKEVSNAIVDYVNETKPLDDGMNGRASPRRGFVWLESSFVGTKPIDSPGTPDTPSTFIARANQAVGGAQARANKEQAQHFRFDTHELPTATSVAGGGERMASRREAGGGGDHTESTSSTSHYTSYISRNEQMEERSNSSSVSSPTLEDILDSLLALRRPNKKFRHKQAGEGKGHESATSPTPPATTSATTSTTTTSATTTSFTTTASVSTTSSKPSEHSEEFSSSHHYSSVSSATPPTTAATYGSSSFTDDITSVGSAKSLRDQGGSPSKSKYGSTSTYQYQYSTSGGGTTSSDIPPSSTTSEIYTTPGGTTYRSSGTTSSYQSDWQERMNQPLPDSTFSYGTTSANVTSRFSSGSVGGDPVSSPGSLVSSLHSTPTHQPYRQSSSTTTTTSGGGGGAATSKDYYSSSCHSSPAKSILAGSTTGTTSGAHGGLDRHSDSNELLYSASSTQRRVTSASTSGGVSTSTSTTRDPEEEDELAFGTLPTDIPRASGNNNPQTSASAAASASTSGGTTVAPLQGGVIVNPLTGLSEYSNPPTPARHRRVSFDLDFSDKEEKSSSRSRNKEENVGGTIQCRNTKCAKTATGLEARREFKVCHNCNAYYCSRECRRAHWEKHKKTCMQSRVGAICKQIISHVKEDSYVMNQLSTTAKRGFLAKGRGCVKLFFNSPDRAERFLTGGLPELPEPLYIPHSDMLPEEMGVPTFSELGDQCRSYNPDTRFVLYACVCVVNEVPTYGAVKWERELISRCSKLRLLLPRHFFEENQRHHHAPSNPTQTMSTALQSTQQSTSPAGGAGGEATSTNGSGSLHASPSHRVPLYDSVPMQATTSDLPDPPPPLPPPHQSSTSTGENNDTLILRSVPPPSSHQLNAAEHKRLREVSFANIQKHLLLRGVDIKRTYPDIFQKLCRYVEHDEPFLPVTIYPRNQETGRQFVCVIMPECSDSTCEHPHTSQANQEATIAAAVASAAAFSSSFAATAGMGFAGAGQNRPGLQRVETINISEPGDDLFDDEHIDLT